MSEREEALRLWIEAKGPIVDGLPWNINEDVLLELIRLARAQPQQGEPDCWAILTPNGSRLVSPEEAKGMVHAYPLYRASPPAQAVPVAEIKWLIERGSPAEYLADIHFGADEWTQDAHAAMKFPNEKVAQEWRQKRFPLRIMTDLRICEHVYCDEPPAQPAAVPEGFVLVPKELPEDVIKCFVKSGLAYSSAWAEVFRKFWRHALSAAPPPPKVDKSGEMQLSQVDKSEKSQDRPKVEQPDVVRDALVRVRMWDMVMEPAPGCAEPCADAPAIRRMIDAALQSAPKPREKL